MGDPVCIPTWQPMKTSGDNETWQDARDEMWDVILADHDIADISFEDIIQEGDYWYAYYGIAKFPEV